MSTPQCELAEDQNQAEFQVISFKPRPAFAII